MIPCLLIQKKGLVKTTKFSVPKYIGDPINTVKIFNEKNVDEIFIADIEASINKTDPDYKLIANLAIECRMPLCYAGGINSIEKALKIIELGVEKIALGTAAIEQPTLIKDLVARLGSQSVVVVMDIKKRMFKNIYEVFTLNGKKSSGISGHDLAIKMQELGAGEIIINSIDKDGTLSGYDFQLIESIVKDIRIPFSILGGAGSLIDVQNLVNQYHPCGACAGSLFVFKGKHRAVLIQYPNLEDKEKLMSR